MKAQVYIVELGGEWEARLTINSEVDKHYWLVGSYGHYRNLNSKLASIGWLMKEELPLGDACRVVELWGTASKRGGGNEEGSRAAYVGDKGLLEAVRLLLACSEEARRETANVVGTTNHRWWQRGGPRLRELETSKESLLPLGELWLTQGHKARGGSGREDHLAGHMPGGTRLNREREGDKQFDRGLEELAAWALLAADVMQGRALLRSEAHALLLRAAGPGAAAGWSGVLQLAALLGRVRLGGSVAAGAGGRSDAWRRRRRERSCLRCGSGEALLHRTACAACGRECAYCTACIGMGRSRECELLVTGQRSLQVESRPPMLQSSVEQRLVKWGLSPAQSAAAAKALSFVEEPAPNPVQTSWDEAAVARDFLLWAVTGAGKTEMIFPLVESVLLRGGRALIATPRRDVVIELDPRIRKAFPDASVVTLYGGSEQRWESGDITLATTHQLLRFYRGFDLVIVDELDAFPFVGDKILHYAADKSCAPGAARLLLSATPPSELQRAARRGKLQHARVPVRYHRHPLPVPKLYQTPTVLQMLHQRKLPVKLQAAMLGSLKRGAQLFVFVQKIAQTEPMAAMLRNRLQHSFVEATSSQDAERTDKVKRFRSREIRVLVTTTILERGVTIPKSDVYILDADGGLFDEASLVQMAGRAGRSADDPFGQVYFCSRERNRAQLSAVRHIQTMNRMARKQGFLLPTSKGGSAK
jgi:competence protein ComFA